jgi:hypothetical protein
MAMAQSKPIFQLKADCDPTVFATVRLTQTYADGCTVKHDVPTTDGTRIEAVLYCIREIQETADALLILVTNFLTTFIVHCMA